MSNSLPTDVSSILTDAYVFGYPLVLTEVTRAGAPTNQLTHTTALPTPASSSVVAPNLDTLYSSAWLDVQSEPVVLQVPAMSDRRYWLMQILDAWTNTAHNPSSVHPKVRTGPDSGPFTYLITGPSWCGVLPQEMTQLAVPTGIAWLIGRVQVDGPADLANVRVVQQQMRLTPLSDWPAGVRPLARGGSSGNLPPPRQVAAMDGRTFFGRICGLMSVDPPATLDGPAMERFATIGLVPGGNVDGLSSQLLDSAVTAAKQRITSYNDPQAKLVNGWSLSATVGTYGTNYLMRASVALRGLGANLAEDALYFGRSETADTNGAPSRFVLSFPAGLAPPADAFWSLTAYDADGYLLANPANIYAVGHQVPPVPSPDGSIRITIQSENPGSTIPAGNWLPIPASGRFRLTLRLYSPRPEALDGQWQPPPLVSP